MKFLSKFLYIIFVVLFSCDDNINQFERDLSKYEEINDVLPLWGKFDKATLDSDLGLMDCLFFYHGNPNDIMDSMIEKGWRKERKNSQLFFSKNNYNIFLFFDEKSNILNVVIYYKKVRK